MQDDDRWLKANGVQIMGWLISFSVDVLTKVIILYCFWEIIKVRRQQRFIRELMLSDKRNEVLENEKGNTNESHKA